MVDRILRFLDSVTFPTFTWTFSLLSPHCPKPAQSIIPFTAVCSHVEQVSSMLSLGLGCPSPVGSFHGLLFHSPLSESLSVSTLLLSEPPFFFLSRLEFSCSQVHHITCWFLCLLPRDANIYRFCIFSLLFHHRFA